MPRFWALLSVLSLVFVSSCTIRFNDWDISQEVKTFSIQQFETTAGNAPPTLGQQFSEQIKERVMNDTRLLFAPNKGDIQFSGAVTNYDVSPIAPQPGATVSLQRLTIKLNIQFRDNTNKEKNWEQSFNRFSDFSAEVDISSVESQLVEEIYAQIIEDVFNKAFGNW